MFTEKKLMETYAKLKSLEKVVELNLGVLEELEDTLFDNLEEIDGYLQLVNGDGKILLSKVKANIGAILKHISLLKEKLEKEWEVIEFCILDLILNKEIPEFDRLKQRSIYDLQEKLDLLRDFIEFQWSLFEEELKKYNLYQKFPAEVYISFFEKITEFNKQI
jgi:hypothetical protein